MQTASFTREKSEKNMEVFQTIYRIMILFIEAVISSRTNMMRVRETFYHRQFHEILSLSARCVFCWMIMYSNSCGICHEIHGHYQLR